MANPQNLRPPWKKGETGNPKGRGTAGATIREYLNAWADKGATLSEIRKIRKDPKAPAMQRLAAQRVLAGIEKLPEAEFVTNQTAGQPKQPIEHDMPNKITFVFE